MALPPSRELPLVTVASWARAALDGASLGRPPQDRTSLGRGTPDRTALGRATRVVLGQAFEHTVNLELVEGDGGRERVTVLNLAGEVTGPAQAVPEPGELADLRRSWAPGTEVRLLWEDAAVVGMATPVLPVLAMDNPAITAAASAIGPWLGRSWFASDQGQAFGLPALDAAIGGDPVRLLGMGAGLTPAGDDALVALIAWTRCTGGGLSAFEALAPLVDGSTTSTSATLLRCALDGQTSVALNDLLLAVAALTGTALARRADAGTRESLVADARVLPQRIAAVASSGHSSGADALFALHRLWTNHSPAGAPNTPATATPVPSAHTPGAHIRNTPLPPGEQP